MSMTRQVRFLLSQTKIWWSHDRKFWKKGAHRSISRQVCRKICALSPINHNLGKLFAQRIFLQHPPSPPRSSKILLKLTAPHSPLVRTSAYLLALFTHTIARPTFVVILHIYIYRNCVLKEIPSFSFAVLELCIRSLSPGTPKVASYVN